MTSIAASVDFGQKARRKDMSGFIHGISTTNAPRNEIISRLRPAIWRTQAGSGGLFTRLDGIDEDMVKIVVCSDAVGAYPILPADDTTFATTCASLATYHAGQNVIFDILNEPDYVGNYNGTANEAYATFKAGYDAIRGVLGPNAIIMGPSCATYNNTFITGFLDYCEDNYLNVQALAWHEFVDSDPSVIPTHVSTIRTALETRPNVGVKKIYIPEHTRDTSWMYPGDCLNYLYYLAEADVDGACRACWNNVATTNTCFDNSLTNLVDSATGDPHAVYYAYEWYAEIKRAQVKCTSGNSYLAVMASACPTEVLIGFGNSATATVDVPLTLDNLGAVGLIDASINIDIYKVGTTGETIVNAPDFVETKELSVSDGTASTTLYEVNAHELYKVVLRAST